MPCGSVSPDSRVVTVAVPAASGRSSMILPSSGALTRRSPSGVQASIRASGTRAHTRAVQPDGTVSVCVVDSAPPPSPAGTTSGVWTAPLAPGPPTRGRPRRCRRGRCGERRGRRRHRARLLAGRPGAGRGAPAATTAASTATVKPCRGTVMGTPYCGTVHPSGRSASRAWSMVMPPPCRSSPGTADGKAGSSRAARVTAGPALGARTLPTGCRSGWVAPGGGPCSVRHAAAG